MKMKIRPIPDLTKEEIERLLDKFDIGDYNECWIWKRAKSKLGHGRVAIRAKSYSAYRVVYRVFKQQPDINLVMDHRVCSNPSCVNPHHLREVTLAENSLRTDKGYCGVKARATYCPKGHPLSGDNLWIRKKKGRKPSRECLECHRFRKRVCNKTEEQNKRTRELERISKYKRHNTKEARDKKNAYERERVKKKKALIVQSKP